MTNKYFPDERITEDDVFFVCSMIERVARKCGHRNGYIPTKSAGQLAGYMGMVDKNLNTPEDNDGYKWAGEPSKTPKPPEYPTQSGKFEN